MQALKASAPLVILNVRWSIIDTEFPYNLPIWRSSHRVESPNKKYIAKIDPAYEVSMGNPTYGTLRLSNGLSLPKCNPSFIWSDDSKYLAVPQFTSNWFWGIGKQRLLIIDVNKNRGWQSPKIAYYIQPETFRVGELTVTLNPFRKAKTMTYSIPKDLGTFTTMTLPPNKALQGTP